MKVLIVNGGGDDYFTILSEAEAEAVRSRGKWDETNSVLIDEKDIVEQGSDWIVYRQGEQDNQNAIIATLQEIEEWGQS